MKRGRVCFRIFAAKSTSVLIYIQHTVVFVSLLKISELYIISKSYGGPYKKHIITAHVLQQTTPYRLYYYYCCTDAGVSGANIGDQSRACDTRSCSASESTSVLIYILNTVHCCFCITFKNQRAVHHFQAIRRAVQKVCYHCSRTTDYSVPYYYCCIDAGVPRANIGDQSRACETRSCLFLCPCIGVDICTDIHTEYSTHCVVLYYF